MGRSGQAPPPCGAARGASRGGSSRRTGCRATERAHQAAGGVAGEQYRLADHVDRARDLRVVLGDALAEVRMLMRTQGAPVLAQVERVEGVALHREALCHVTLEKIVAETVQEERRAARRFAAIGQADQRGQRAAVVVVRELELERLEPGQEA